MKRTFKYLTTFSPVTLIDYAAGVLVLLIALAALGISFANLAVLAGVNGFDAWEANLWAGQVDGFILVATLAVLRAHLTGARARYAWFLVGVTTGVSVLLNAFHGVAHPWLAVGMRGLPPVTLFLSFHLLMGFVQEWVERAGLARTRAELEGQVSALSTQRADLETAHTARVHEMDKEFQTRTDKLDILKAERADTLKDVRAGKKELSEILLQLDTARTELATMQAACVDNAAPEAGQGDEGAAYVWTSVDDRRLHVLTLTRAGHVPGEIAGMVSPAVNEKTIRRDVLALNGKVAIES